MPETYNLFTSTMLKNLLKEGLGDPPSLDFGRIYEYFLGEFAMSEGKGGDELYTPSSIVRLLAEAARRATWIGERQPHGETVSTAKTLLKP